MVTTKKPVCRSWVCCRLLSLLMLSTSRDPLKQRFWELPPSRDALSCEFKLSLPVQKMILRWVGEVVLLLEVLTLFAEVIWSFHKVT